MQGLQSYASEIAPLSLMMYFGIGFAVWYIVYGLEAYMNGGSLGRGRWWLFKCFWEEVQWFLPGGLAKRANHIRALVKPNSNDRGYLGGYSYEEIREYDLYEQVAKKSLGNGFYFWGVNVVLSFFLWPLMLGSLVALIALNGVIGLGSTVYSVATTILGIRSRG